MSSPDVRFRITIGSNIESIVRYRAEGSQVRNPLNTNLQSTLRSSRRNKSIGLWSSLIIVVVLIGGTLSPAPRLILTSMLVFLVGVLALQVFSGNSGVLSFGHLGFVGISAYTTGILSMPVAVKETSLSELPMFLQQTTLAFPIAMLAGIGVATIVGALTGLVISRLKNSASIATVGILIIIHSTLVGAEDFTRGSQTFYGVERFTSLEVAGTFAILALVAARTFRDSGIGLHVRASRDDSIAASSSGVRIQKSQYIAWVISSSLAGAMGSCYAGLLGAFSPKDFYFGLTLTLLTMLIVGGSGSVAGAVVGVVAVTLISESLRKIGDSIGLVGLTNAGLAVLILLTLYLRPKGIMGGLEPEEVYTYKADPPKQEKTDFETDLSIRAVDTATLQVEKVSKQFSGLLALDNAHLEVKFQKITGLIGPNGSGKSTLVNCITGVTSPDVASIRLNKVDITKWPAWRRARAGLGRTFQNIRLFKELTVLDNVSIACISTGKSVSDADAQSLQLLAQLGVSSQAYRFPGELSFGDQRRVEIARALALNPTVLLLDEPAAGMNPSESLVLLDQFRNIIADLKIGMLLIDHDVALIRSACDSLTVIDQGKILAEGNPQEVLSQPEVHRAYLGWDEEINHAKPTGKESNEES